MELETRGRSGKGVGEKERERDGKQKRDREGERDIERERAAERKQTVLLVYLDVAAPALPSHSLALWSERERKAGVRERGRSKQRGTHKETHGQMLRGR